MGSWSEFLTLLAIIAGLVQWRSDRKKKERSLAASLGAEVAALKELVERRDFVGELRRANHEDRLPYVIPIREREILPIYAANLQNVGLLGPELCRKLARHYTAIESFLDQNAEYSKNPQKSSWDSATLKDSSVGHIELADEIFRMQDDLVPALDRIADEPAWQLESIVSMVRRVWS